MNARRPSVFHVSPSGDDAGSGAAGHPLRTIGRAAELAQPGDIITVHEGVYREYVNPPRGGLSDEQRIVYRAAPGETVTIKGSEVVTGWSQVEGDTWTVTLPNSFFGTFNPYTDILHGDWYEAKRPYHTGAVYLDGHWLEEAAQKGEVLPSVVQADDGECRPELMNIRDLDPEDADSPACPASAFVAGSDELETSELPDGQSYVGRMRDGTTVTYEIDCGKLSRFVVLHAASPLAGGIVEVHKGDADGDVVARLDVGFAAEWTTFQPYHAVFKEPLSGKQRLTLVFSARPQDKNAKVSDRDKWFAEVGDDSTTIWAQFKGVDPNEAAVEINVRQCVIYPDQPGRNYITVQGFTLEHAAAPWCPPTAEQPGLLGTHWSKGWIIEDNTIRYSTCVGVTLGKYGDEHDNTHDMWGEVPRAVKNGWNRETVGHHVVRNNHIYNCGQAGIVGSLGCAFSTITGNEIHEIKKDHQYGGCESCGIKLHGFVDGIISHNHIYNCEHWGGIWLDWMGQGARVTANLLHDNSQDLMFEINHGPFLVDHNLLLSRTAVTKVSSSGVYAHNLWTDSINIWPTEGRKPPFFKPHSTEIVEWAPIDQNDDHYYNNVFVDCAGPAKLSEHDFSCIASGNVYLAGAQPSTCDEAAIVQDDFAPAIRLSEEVDGWWLEMQVDPAWLTALQRGLVTTERIGKGSVTDAPCEVHDGSPYWLDTDYFGTAKSADNPAPGPFGKIAGARVCFKVWSKNGGICR